MPAENIYRIKQGDTLIDLFGQNWQEVAASNGIEDPTKLQIGQEIDLNLYDYSIVPQGQEQQVQQEQPTNSQGEPSGEEGFLSGAAAYANTLFKEVGADTRDVYENLSSGMSSFGNDVYSSFSDSDIGFIPKAQAQTEQPAPVETPVVDPFQATAAAGISAALPSVSTEGSNIYKNMLETKGAQYGLDNSQSLRRFLATIAVETGDRGFAASENLNYSLTALLDGSRNARADRAEARRVARTDDHAADQEGVANLRYANMNGNGNRASGDGWKFRGMGAIQLTGRGNYTAVGELMGLTADELADKRDDKAVQLEAAMAYWKLNNLGEDITMDKTTDIVNKHTPSRGERQLRFDNLESVFNP